MTVYLEDLDVFDEFEKKFKDFLKSTPYIEQILQTSKEYRMIIESLNILAVIYIINILKFYRDLMMNWKEYAQWLRLWQTKAKNFTFRNRRDSKLFKRIESWEYKSSHY